MVVNRTDDDELNPNSGPKLESITVNQTSNGEPYAKWSNQSKMNLG